MWVLLLIASKVKKQVKTFHQKKIQMDGQTDGNQSRAIVI